MTPFPLSASEASYVLDRPKSAVDRAVDDRVICATVRQEGRQKQRLLGRPEIWFLWLERQLQGSLTPAGRRRLYEAVRQHRAGDARLSFGGLTLDVERMAEALKGRLDRLETLRAAVDGHGSDEPLLRGTAVPVYVVAALAKGQTAEEVVEDYPGLTRAQIDAAVDYARAYPKRGRPHPARSFKRMLGDLDLRDVGVAPSEEGPRLIPSP